ncbi:MAG: hypothetical protein R2831_11165 [Chitinophagaceae bacterium]
MLCLGAGLGSGLKILQEKYQVFPSATLVDIDQDVLAWSQEYMSLNTKQNVMWIQQDALEFLHTSETKYDLIMIDLFIDLKMPHFVKNEEFLDATLTQVQAKGVVIFNTVFEQKIVQNRFENTLNQKFYQVEKMYLKLNSIYVCIAF